MVKQNTRYFSVILLLSLTACNGGLNTVKSADPTPLIEQEEVAQQKSVWQEAYGEEQEPQQNELGALPEVEPEIVLPIDLWQRIRDGYAIPHASMHADTKKQLDWFVRHPEYINRVAERAEPYLHYIVEQVEQRDMPMEMVLLPVVESAFQPFAYSSGRAAGLWQFIPGTGKLYGLKQNWWYDGRRDVVESTRAALDYLQKLHNDFGDWQLALAAYNCGEGCVGRAIKKNIKAGKGTDFWSLDLPKETSAYVPKLMAISKLIAEPEEYQLTLRKMENEPYFSAVNIKGQIDLALAAELAELKIEEMYQLNPGFNQWATDPEGPHRLVIPLDKVDVFLKALAALPEDKHVKWARHKIKSGESLGKIAQQYKTAVSVIKKANDIGGTTIRAGRYLLIPVASGDAVDYSLSTGQRLAARQNTPQKGNKKTHTVKQGDTWWDVARLYKVSVKKLASWNNKAPGDYLQPGQKLVVWTSKTSTSKAKSDTVRSVNYEIRSGDSLWTISQKFKVSVAQVRQWNGLSRQTPLQPGQNLTLYVDVREQHSNI